MQVMQLKKPARFTKGNNSVYSSQKDFIYMSGVSISIMLIASLFLWAGFLCSSLQFLLITDRSISPFDYNCIFRIFAPFYTRYSIAQVISPDPCTKAL